MWLEQVYVLYKLKCDAKIVNSIVFDNHKSMANARKKLSRVDTHHINKAFVRPAAHFSFGFDTGISVVIFMPLEHCQSGFEYDREVHGRAFLSFA